MLKNLSWKARGILCYLITLPNNKHICMSLICNHATDGHTSVVSGIKELIDKGYLKRTRRFNNKKQFAGYKYKILKGL